LPAPQAERRSSFGKARYREPPCDIADLGGKPPLLGRIVARRNGANDDPPDLAHLRRPETACRGSRRSDPDPRSHVRRMLVEWDGVLVDGYADLVEEPLGLFARDSKWRHVDEHEVIVRA